MHAISVLSKQELTYMFEGDLLVTFYKQRLRMDMNLSAIGSFVC